MYEFDCKYNLTLRDQGRYLNQCIIEDVLDVLISQNLRPFNTNLVMVTPPLFTVVVQSITTVFEGLAAYCQWVIFPVVGFEIQGYVVWFPVR